MEKTVRVSSKNIFGVWNSLMSEQTFVMSSETGDRRSLTKIRDFALIVSLPEICSISDHKIVIEKLGYNKV